MSEVFIPGSLNLPNEVLGLRGTRFSGLKPTMSSTEV